MPKNITVQNIIDTNHSLNRFANYARRHMDNVPIEQFSESVDDVRKSMQKMQRDFMGVDVTTLTPIKSRERRELENIKITVKNYKQCIKNDKIAIENFDSENPGWDDLESLQVELENDERYLQEHKDRKKELKKLLA